MRLSPSEYKAVALDECHEVYKQRLQISSGEAK